MGAFPKMYSGPVPYGQADKWFVWAESLQEPGN